MPIKLIINPAAGSGQAKKIGQQVQDILTREDVPFSVDEIYKPGGGTFLAERAVEQGFGMVVAIGGDGTANEVALGIMKKNLTDEKTDRIASTIFGLIPAGIGNDFAKSLGLPPQLPELCQLLVKKRTHTIDIGRLNDRIFLNSAGIGLDATIAKSVNENTKKSKRLYLKNTLRTLLRFKSTKMSLQVETTPAFTMTPSLLTVMNGQVLGSYFNIAPHALLDDGLLDVCLGEKTGRLKLLFQLAKVLKGGIKKVKGMNTFTVESLKVKAPQSVLAHVDGETFEGDTFHFHLLPHALPVLHP